jgi:hypothetical protein
LAQDQTDTRHVPAAVIDSGQQQFIIDNALALSKMTLSMTVDPTSALNCDRELSARFRRGEPSATRFVGSFPDRVRSDRQGAGLCGFLRT